MTHHLWRAQVHEDASDTILVGIHARDGYFIVSADIDNQGEAIASSVIALHRVGDRILVDPPNSIAELTVQWPRRWCWPFTHHWQHEYRFARCLMCGKVRP